MRPSTVISTTDSTPLRAVCETRATVAPLDAPPPPRRFYTYHTTIRHRFHHLPGPYHTRARTEVPRIHSSRTYILYTHTRAHKVQDSAAAVAAASKRAIEQRWPASTASRWRAALVDGSTELRWWWPPRRRRVERGCPASRRRPDDDDD